MSSFENISASNPADFKKVAKATMYHEEEAIPERSLAFQWCSTFRPETLQLTVEERTIWNRMVAKRPALSRLVK